MATIALYENRINQMPTLISDIRNSTSGYSSELFSLKQKSLNVASNVCNLDDVINSIQSSTETLERKAVNLQTFQLNHEVFVEEVAQVDDDVAVIVNQNKDDFYGKYTYLKPDYEKSGLEQFGDDIASGLASFGEWCKEHWVEIVLTIVIVIGAVLAIAAVIATGGMALVPLLAGALSYFGVAGGLALSIATGVSLVIAATAIVSTVVSSGYNIADLWGDYDDDSGFQSAKNTWNTISLVTNLLYSFGGIVNSITGISNSSLRAFAKGMTNKNFFTSVFSFNNTKLVFGENLSTFWAGIGGESVATAYATQNGVQTLGQVIPQAARDVANATTWTPPSMSMAISSSGKATALLSSNVGSIASNGTVVGNTWLTVEKVILNINPRITSLTTISNFGTAAQAADTVSRTFQLSSLIQSVMSGGQFAVSGTELDAYNTKEGSEAQNGD